MLVLQSLIFVQWDENNIISLRKTPFGEAGRRQFAEVDRIFNFTRNFISQFIWKGGVLPGGLGVRSRGTVFMYIRNKLKPILLALHYSQYSIVTVY